VLPPPAITTIPCLNEAEISKARAFFAHNGYTGEGIKMVNSQISVIPFTPALRKILRRSGVTRHSRSPPVNNREQYRSSTNFSTEYTALFGIPSASANLGCLAVLPGGVIP
jgi:hypothetical protein